ncbi:MAG: hypothetical protein GX616_21870 [Planctomycetes bacterium]|nr:hypothetical protein [Planctomycetota bacterium]
MPKSAFRAKPRTPEAGCEWFLYAVDHKNARWGQRVFLHLRYAEPVEVETICSALYQLDLAASRPSIEVVRVRSTDLAEATRRVWRRLAAHAATSPDLLTKALASEGRAMASASQREAAPTVTATAAQAMLEGEWLTPGRSLIDLANRLGNVGRKKARTMLNPYGLQNVNDNRQMWTVRLDAMPRNMRDALVK